MSPYRRAVSVARGASRGYGIAVTARGRGECSQASMSGDAIPATRWRLRRSFLAGPGYQRTAEARRSGAVEHSEVSGDQQDAPAGQFTDVSSAVDDLRVIVRKPLMVGVVENHLEGDTGWLQVMVDGV
jgi:hypothetical protein